MPPKREASQTVRLSFDEQEVLRRCADPTDDQALERFLSAVQRVEELKKERAAL